MIGDLTFVAWFAGAVGMAYLWVKIFASAEDHVSDDVKTRIRRWFAPRLGADPRPNWAGSFIDLFDQTFSPNVLSLRFFVRSCIATTLFFGVMLLIYVGYGVLTVGSVEAFYTKCAFGTWPCSQWLLLIFCGNLLADYVSLIETRLVLGWIRDRGRGVQALGVIIDALLTGVIYVAVASALYEIEGTWQRGVTVAQHIEFVTAIDLADQAFFRWSDGSTSFFWVSTYIFGDAVGFGLPRDRFGLFYANNFRISFVTTYFTSVWIWLFVLAGMLGRVAFFAKGGLTRFGRLFKVNEVPVTAVGYTISAITLALHVGVFALAQAWPSTP